MALTQVQIGDHLDLSQKQVSEWLPKLGKTTDHTLDEIRVAYIRALRSSASGHSGDQQSLVYERVQTERVTRELMQLQLHEKLGLLVNVEQLRGRYEQLIVACRVRLEALADTLKDELDAIHGIDVDRELVAGHVHDALAQLSRYDPSDRSVPAFADDVDAPAGADDDDPVGGIIPGDVAEVDGEAG